MLGRITPSVLKGSFLTLCSLALGTGARSALATTAPILDIYGATLTVDPQSQSSHQPMWGRFQQRGVDIDGTLRWPVPLGWAVAGDPLGGGYSAGRKIGDVNLCTGSYNPTDVDIALPTLGLPIVIGRTYSCVQEDGSGGYLAYDGYQGVNWVQTAQPQITLVPGTTNDLDVVYLSYGNDRFIEFQRIALNATQFKAKNGAAGVIDYTASTMSQPDLYTYYDQRGDQIVFIGFSGSYGNGPGQLWKMTDPAGNVAYVDNTSSAATAGSNGYDISNRMKTFYDASGRKYLFTYNSFGPNLRLQTVEAQIVISAVYTTIAKVDYDYYTSNVADGISGDLRLVTTTMKGVSGGDYVRTKYYRYYTSNSWTNTDGLRGVRRQLKMVVGYDGIRQADVALSIASHNYTSTSDSALMPYAEGYFEYISAADRRLLTATFNGNCGCAGGTSGTYTFSYGTASTFAADTTDTTYQNGWEQRTIVGRPDGTYVTQYFDETGGVLGQVITDSDTAGSPTKMWATNVVRNSSGQVISIHSPANCVNGSYSYSAGTFSHSSSNGLVTTYARHSASSNIDGLRDSVSVQEGTSGSASMVSSVSIADRQLTVGSSGVSIPQVNTTSTYPSGTNLDTGYSYTYWSSTASNVQYLAPKSITTTNPTVSSGTNGSNSATTKARYLHTDGTTAFTKDETNVLFYSGRDSDNRGQTAVQIADANTSTTGDYVAEDMSGGSNLWSVTTSGSAIHAKTTVTYDDQGRLITRTAPAYGLSGSTTRTVTYKYVLDGAELGTFVSPLLSGGNYYGPLSYSRINHTGKQDRRATIEIGTPAGTIPTSTTPNTTTGTAWSAQVDTNYDQSGMRATSAYTYTAVASHDDTSMSYDAIGRRDRTVDATGTISRLVFDERGLVIERWMGTNDNSWTSTHTYASPGSVSGSSNMVKIEAREYDNATDGGNAYLTKRSQDSTGAWSGGIGDRATAYLNDYRGRAAVIESPAKPHSVTAYDNSNRPTATAQYNSTSGLSLSTNPTTSTASTHVALRETAYDERGQVFESTRWEIIQSGGSAGNKNNSIVTDNWYDNDGRLVASRGEKITKTKYDRLGRPKDRFLVAIMDDTNYSTATRMSTDIVLEQTHYAIDPTSGKPLSQWLVQRAHDDDSSGSTDALDTNGDANDLALASGDLQNNARPQITAMWYDDLERVTDSVRYGTNGGSTFTRPGSAPSSLVTRPKTSYHYDGAGRVDQVTDPVGIVSVTAYDFAGRKTSTDANYVNGDPQTTAGTNNDQDQRIDYTYTNGLVTAITREMPKTSTAHDNDQETDYAYDTTAGGGASVIKRKNLLTTITNPDSTTTGYVYNALSEKTSTTDPAGNVIATGYDARGRISSRTVTTFAGGFDTRVKEIDTGYEARGMMNDVKQKNSGGTVLDETAYTFDGWGNLIAMDQDPDSAIGGSGQDFQSDWTYTLNSSTGGWRNLYVTQQHTPDGSVGGLEVDWTPFSTIDFAVGRPELGRDASFDIFAEYSYLGASTIVGMGATEPAVVNQMYGSGGSSDYASFMDELNRPTTFQWTKTMVSAGSGVSFVDDNLTYDKVGNVKTLTDNVLRSGGAGAGVNNFDQVNTYDNLHRLIERDEGAISGASIGTASRGEFTPRNLAGRITEDSVDSDGDGNFDTGSLSEIKAGDMQDSRMFNKRNQLTARSYYDNLNPISGLTPVPLTLTYDANGNMTGDGEKYTYTYNPFNQLVQIYDTTLSATAANYTYDGLGHRITEQTDTNNSGLTGGHDGVVDSSDSIFYIATDPQGRRVASFRGGDTYAKETLIYHAPGVRGPAFTGGLALRDRNSNLSTPTNWDARAGSTRSERDYYCSDFKGNVTALVTAGGSSAGGGTLLEQYRYTASGVPIGIPPGDINGDGSTDSADASIVSSIIAGPLAYETRADLDLDGLVDKPDNALESGFQKSGSGRGELTDPSVGNRDGQCGNEEFGEGLEFLYFSACGGVIDAGLARTMQESMAGGSSYQWDSADAAGTTCTACGGIPPYQIPTPPAGAPPMIIYPPPQYWDPNYECSEAGAQNPLPSTSSQCDDYKYEDEYDLANAQCFCSCAGDSAWAQFVRSCLRCMYNKGNSPSDSHTYCYAQADDRAPGRPYLTLAYCFGKCFLEQVRRTTPHFEPDPMLGY